MTPSSVIAALCLPADARVDQRVPKKLLLENGAHNGPDKRQINDGVEELHWVATLKPDTVGVPVFRDDTREYLEIAVLSLTLRTGAKTPRLTELIHRAIPYPVFLIQSQPGTLTLSLAHLRWSQAQSGQTVLDGPLVMAQLTAEEIHGAAEQAPTASAPSPHDASPLLAFFQSLSLTGQPRQHLHALYQGWMDRFEAHAAARLTGSFAPPLDAAAAERRRASLADHERLSREIISLRARAAKEKQINRRVDLNLAIHRLEAQLAAISRHL